jgi:uncharacterized protein (TIGR03000 family)
MYRQIFARINLTALALLGALLVPEPAAAQQGWHLYKWSGGWSSGPVDSFYYRGGNGGFEYPALSYSYSMPGYYTLPSLSVSDQVTGYEGGFRPRIAQDYGYFGVSAAGDTSSVNGAVLINLSVPANAEISFDGQETVQRGAFRQFVSPPLFPGNEYSYDIEVRWTENGTESSQSRRITVHAGDIVNLFFHSGADSASTVP